MVEDASEPFSRSDGTGYANDLVRAAYKAAGFNVKLNVVPYARCKELLKRAVVPACFAMSWSKDLDNTGIVFAREPLFEVYADIYRNGKVSGLVGSVEGVRAGMTLGIINGYEYPDEIAKMEKSGVRLERNGDDIANLKMLAHGRLDAVVLMTSDFDKIDRRLAAAGARGYANLAFRSGLMKSYIAFNLKNPAGKIALDAFERGYSSISSNHEKDRIRDRWMKAAQQ